MYTGTKSRESDCPSLPWNVLKPHSVGNQLPFIPGCKFFDFFLFLWFCWGSCLSQGPAYILQKSSTPHSLEFSKDYSRGNYCRVFSTVTCACSLMDSFASVVSQANKWQEYLSEEWCSSTKWKTWRKASSNCIVLSMCPELYLAMQRKQNKKI